MKLYKEMLRKLMPIGAPLAVATLIYTVIVGGQNCFGKSTLLTPQSAVGITPVLVYYVFSAILFALYGFSFLFKRAASDLYHSLPVKRLDMYVSVTAATASWMGATIIINVLVMLGMLLVSGCPFVPVLIPLTILFYFVASMLVYAAAAIGCALSGTLVTALASTAVVLFLPRFIQFIIARGVVAKIPIIGWLDLGTLLNPSTNIATGLVVMQSRQVFISRIVDLPHTLYSIIPLLLELTLGAWLFMRRPSETADKGAGQKAWAVFTACAASLVALLLITVDGHSLFSMYGAALVAIAFLVFIVYQLLASRNVKQVLISLPCFLLAAAVALGISAGIDSATSKMLNITPSAEEIASVTFRGHDEKLDNPEYATFLMPEVSYTSESIKEYVADTLADAVAKIKDPMSDAYVSYSRYWVIEPLTITLKNGQKINRTIEFGNVEALNELRSTEPLFQQAIQSFPPENSVQYCLLDSTFTKEETQKIWDSYVSESKELGLVVNDYYRENAWLTDDNGNVYTSGSDQSIASIYTAGYTGVRSYYNTYTVRLQTPKTCKLIMQTYNAHSQPDSIARLSNAVKHMLSPLALQNDSVSLDMVLYNMPFGDGKPITKSIGLYISGYTKDNQRQGDLYAEYSAKFTDIIKRGKLTDDPSGVFLRLSWYEYDSSNRESTNEPQSYLAFSAEDQQALIDLMGEWEIASMTSY